MFFFQIWFWVLSAKKALFLSIISFCPTKKKTMVDILVGLHLFVSSAILSMCVCVFFFISFTVVHRVFSTHKKKKQIQLVNHWLFHSLEIGRNCYKLFTLNNSFATSSRHEIYALHTMELHIVVSSLSHVPFFIFIYW